MAALESSGNTQLCRITNVSSQGLQARVFVPINKGERVCIRVPDEFTADGEVVWIDGNVIGIQLTNALPASALLRFAGGELGHRRRLPRIQSSCEVQLSSHPKIYHCTLVNISPAGAMVVPRNDLPPPGPVEISVPDLPKLKGQVRWIDENRVGILFNNLLPLGQLANWLMSWGVVGDPPVLADALNAAETPQTRPGSARRIA
jgi:hypothetical protein